MPAWWIFTKIKIFEYVSALDVKLIKFETRNQQLINAYDACKHLGGYVFLHRSVTTRIPPSLLELMWQKHMLGFFSLFVIRKRKVVFTLIYHTNDKKYICGKYRKWVIVKVFLIDNKTVGKNIN